MSTLDVRVTLLRARDVKDVSITGNLDLYLAVKCQSETIRSATVKTDKPALVEWGTHVLEDKLQGIHEESILTFLLYDEKQFLIPKKTVGIAKAVLSELMGDKEKVRQVTLFKRTRTGEVDTSEVRGVLCLKIDTQPQLHQPKFTLKAARPKSGGLWIFGETQPLESKYEIGKVLGEGAFGITRKAIKKLGGQEYAVKSIAKSKLISQEAIQDVQREIEVMHHLMGNEHVVQLEEVLEDDKSVHIVMELARGGNLYQYIINRGEYRESDVAGIMKSIVQVVAYCHSMNVLHRDLKPENFLLRDPVKAGVPFLLTTDFGLSCFFHTPNQLFAEVVGTCFYIAPEVLKRRGGQPADIWSAGIIMYILLSGRPPFTGSNEEQVFQNVVHKDPDMRGNPWNIVSPAGKALLRRMLDKDPLNRPTAQEVLADRWFKGEGVPVTPFEPEVLRRLKNFAAANMLKKAALLWLSQNTPEGNLERAGLDAMFDEMDQNRDKELSADELRLAMQKRGTQLSSDSLQELVGRLDINRDGKVTRNEFVAAGMHLMRTRSRQIRDAFHHFATGDEEDQAPDAHSYISLRDLQSALKEYASADLSEILESVDKNRDGKIDFQEFKSLLVSS